MTSSDYGDGVRTFHWRPSHATPDAEPITVHYPADFNGDALMYLPLEVGHVERGTLLQSDGAEGSRVYAIRVPARALGQFGLLYVRGRVEEALGRRAEEVTNGDESADEG